MCVYPPWFRLSLLGLNCIADRIDCFVFRLTTDLDFRTTDSTDALCYCQLFAHPPSHILSRNTANTHIGHTLELEHLQRNVHFLDNT